MMGQLNNSGVRVHLTHCAGYIDRDSMAGSGDRQARRTFAPFFRTIIFILRTTEAAVGEQEIRGRKGEGLTNLLRGVARCADCDDPMRLTRKGSANEYRYLKCAKAVRGECEHRKLHPYRPIEALIEEMLAEIAYRDAPRGDAALQARIAQTRREVAEIEGRLATLRKKLSAKQAKIARLEGQLQPQRQAGEQALNVRRLITRLHRLPAEERRPIRTRISAGLRRIIRGGVMFSPNGDIDIYLSPPEGPRSHREFHLVPVVPDGALVLETAEQVLAAIQAGHRVGAVPPANPDRDLG